MVTQLSGLCQVGHSATSPPMVPRGLLLSIPSQPFPSEMLFLPPKQRKDMPNPRQQLPRAPDAPQTKANTSLHTSRADQAHTLSTSLSHLPAASPFPKATKVRTHIIVSSSEWFHDIDFIFPQRAKLPIRNLLTYTEHSKVAHDR